MWEYIHNLVGRYVLGATPGSFAGVLLPLLLDVAAKATVILLLAILASRTLRRSSAATRHTVWLLTAASLAALPVLTVMVPAWQVLPRWMNPRDVTIHEVATLPAQQKAPLPEPAASDVSPAPSIEPRQTPQPAPVEAAQAKDAPASITAPTATHAASLVDRLSPAMAACLIWLAGAAVVLARTLLGVLSLAYLGRVAEPVVYEAWLDARDSAREDLGIRRDVRLLRSSRRAMPMVWGIVQPRLLIPSDAYFWSAERRRVVLLHELAHVKRLDCLWQLLMQVVCAAYWFHPLAWVARRAMQVECEQACDDLVLTAGSRASDYAEHVLQIASGSQIDRLSGAAAIAMARPSRLEGRLLAILDTTRSRRGLTRAAMILAIVLVAGVVVPVAMLKAGTQDTTVVKKTLSMGETKALAKTDVSSPLPDVTSLAGGGTVELAGVSYYPSIGQPWWRADGSPAGETFTTSGVGTVDPGRPATIREFIIRTMGLAEGASAPAIQVAPCMGTAGGQVESLRVEDSGRLHVLRAYIPTTARTVTVRVGIASGPWTTVAAANSKHGESIGLKDDKGVCFSALQEKDGKSTVVVSFIVDWDVETRIVAVDTDGQLHNTTYGSTGGAGGKLAQRTAIFDLPSASIQAIRLESRPYEWVKFENVALEPNKAHNSERGAEPAMSNAATQPATLPTLIGEPRDEKYFYVMGAIRPGVYSSTEPINLARAVAAAGGLKPDSKFIYLLRPNRQGRLDIIASYPVGNMPMKESEQIQPEDVVYASAQSLTVSGAGQAAAPQGTVEVVGDVGRPGIFSLSPGGTLLKSLATAGMDTSHAYSAYALLIRTYPDGQHGPVGCFPLADMLQGRIADPPLESGDVIDVRIAKTSIPPGQSESGKSSASRPSAGEAGCTSDADQATMSHMTITKTGPNSMTVSGMFATPAPGILKIPATSTATATASQPLATAPATNPAVAAPGDASGDLPADSQRDVLRGDQTDRAEKRAADVQKSLATIPGLGAKQRVELFRKMNNPFSVAPGQPEPTGVIRGKVVFDDADEPISGATVYLFRESTLEAQFLESDEDGQFEFLHVPGDQYSLKVNRAKGFQPSKYDPANSHSQFPRFTLKEGQVLDDVVLRLKQDVAISGRVFDQDGKVLRARKGLTVVAWGRDPAAEGSGGMYKILARASVDGSGQYELRGLSGWPVYVMLMDHQLEDGNRPYPPCYSLGTFSRERATLVQFDKCSWVEGVDIQVPHGGGLVLEGAVTDATTGKPIPKTLVVAHHTDMLFDHVTTYTDEHGHYRLSSLGEGELRVHADATPFNYVRYRKEISLQRNAQPQSLDFALTKGVQISGKFVDLLGNDVAINAGKGFGYGQREDTPTTYSYGGPCNRYGPGYSFMACPMFAGEGAYAWEAMRFPDPSSFIILGLAPGKTRLDFHPQQGGWKLVKILQGQEDITQTGITTQSGQTVDDIRIVLDTGAASAPATD